MQEPNAGCLYHPFRKATQNIHIFSRYYSGQIPLHGCFPETPLYESPTNIEIVHVDPEY